MSDTLDGARIVEIPSADADLEKMATLWNKSLPDDLPASIRALEWALAPHPERSAALLALKRRSLLAWAIVGHQAGSALGTVDAIAPSAETGRKDSSGLLVDAASGWLKTRGASALQFGGGAYSLLRGSPVPERIEEWAGVATRAVHTDGESDLQLDLAHYIPPSDLETVAGVVQTAQPRDADNLAELFAAPELLRVAATNAPATIDDVALMRAVASEGRISDLMVLWTAKGLEGVAHLIFPDSATPIDIAYPYTLPRPWGAIHSLVVRDSLGNGATEMLLDAAARRMHNNGINSSIALGVAAPQVYARFGYVRHRDWWLRAKEIGT